MQKNSFLTFWIFTSKTYQNPFFFPTKMLLSSREFQICSFRRHCFDGSGDMPSRSAFTHPIHFVVVATLVVSFDAFRSVACRRRVYSCREIIIKRKVSFFCPTLYVLCVVRAMYSHRKVDIYIYILHK